MTKRELQNTFCSLKRLMKPGVLLAVFVAVFAASEGREIIFY